MKVSDLVLPIIFIFIFTVQALSIGELNQAEMESYALKLIPMHID